MDYGSLSLDDDPLNIAATYSRRRISKTEKQGASSRLIQSLSTEVPPPAHTDGVYANVFHRTDVLRKMKRRRKKRRKKEAEKFPLAKAQHRSRSCIYTTLNNKSRRIKAVIYKKIMSLIILADLTFFVFSTDPKYRHYHIFYMEEGIASCIFMLEYIARMVTITESRKFGQIGAIKGRLQYMISFHAMIDACATFPFFLEFVTDWNLPTLTYLRFFRLLRILRFDSLGQATASLKRVLFYNREILYVAVVMAGGLIMFTAVLMYYLRPQGGDLDGEEWSIFTTIYYSTLMLTSQGGPGGDLPWYTQVVVLMTGLFSIGMFAIPASILTWGFEAEAERVASKTRKRHLQRISGGRPSSCSSSPSPSYGRNGYHSPSSSDEEYFKLIAGGDGDEENGKSVVKQEKEADESLRKIKELMSSFRDADSDASGSLSKGEFLRLAAPLLPKGMKNLNMGEEHNIIADADKEQISSSLLLERVNRLESKLDRILSLLDNDDK